MPAFKEGENGILLLLLLLKVQELLARRDIPRGASVSAKSADAQKVRIQTRSKVVYKFLYKFSTVIRNAWHVLVK